MAGASAATIASTGCPASSAARSFFVPTSRSSASPSRSHSNPGCIRSAARSATPSRYGFASAALVTLTRTPGDALPTCLGVGAAADAPGVKVVGSSENPGTFTSGTIVIHVSELASRYDNQAYIGYARLSWTSSRSITGAAVWLRYLRYSGDAYAGKRKGILGHELGHAMGFSHMDGSTLSFMEPSLGSKTDLSAFDQMAALLVYSRMPGNASADIEGTSTGKSLSASAFTVTDWMCGAGEDEPRP